MSVVALIIAILTQSSREKHYFGDWRRCIKCDYFYDLKVDFGH